MSQLDELSDDELRARLVARFGVDAEVVRLVRDRDDPIVAEVLEEFLAG